MRVLSSLRKLIADPDVAIDLGTANTRVVAQGWGLVAERPSLTEPEEKAHAHTPGSLVPLRAGVVVNVDAAASLLHLVLRRARRLGLTRPRVLVCTPTDASQDERAALVEATRRAGASEVELVPDPLAAAIGAGLDMSLPYAQLIVDIGDGVTDLAVIRSGAIVSTAALRVACGDLHAAVRQWVEDQHGVRIDAYEAEWLTRTVGALEAFRSQAPLEVVGIDCTSAREARISIPAAGVMTALAPRLDAIVGKIRQTFLGLPDDLAAEVIESGLCLTGGGACLPGMTQRVARETGLEVRLARDPLHAVIDGARQILELRCRL